MAQTLVNGQDLTNLDISDRGLLYGDGFFTTIRVRDGKAEHWLLHAERIRLSAEKLHFPELDIDQIKADIEQLIAKQKNDGAIRLTITRGSGVRGYKPPANPDISRIVSWSNISSDKLSAVETGVALALCDTHDSYNPALAGVKHLNRLPQVLASNEIPDECFDGIMLVGQHIIGGSKTNIYFYQDGLWLTPEMDSAGVDGTVRRWLLSTQRNVKATKFGLEVLHDAQYCMVSNALYGMIPVTKIMQHRYDISPDIATLQQQYRDSALIE